MQKLALTLVTPSNFSKVQKVLEPFMQSSDFYPVTALGYGQGKYISYYAESDFIIVEFANYVGCDAIVSTCFLPRIQPSAVSRAVGALRSIEVKKLRLVPEFTLNVLRGECDCKYRFVPEDADYVFDTEKLAEMAGPCLRRRRREIRRFQRSAVDLKIEVRNKISPSEIRELQKLMRIWQLAKTKNFEADIDPTNFFLKHHSLTQALTLLVRQQEEIIAFCVFEVLTSGMGVFHFIKAHPEIRGATSFVLCQVSKMMREQGVIVVNFAFDMGHDGLRKYKQSLQPVSMIEKAEVWLTSTADAKEVTDKC